MYIMYIIGGESITSLKDDIITRIAMEYTEKADTINAIYATMAEIREYRHETRKPRMFSYWAPNGTLTIMYGGKAFNISLGVARPAMLVSCGSVRVFDTESHKVTSDLDMHFLFIEAIDELYKRIVPMAQRIRIKEQHHEQ